MNNPYARPNGPIEPAEKITSHLLWAILSAVFCCMPLGIVSIVYASKVNSLAATGDREAARAAAENAKKWAIWSAAVQGGIMVLYLIIIGFMFATGDLRRL